MEVNKLWKNNDINKYYIITLDKETNEWKFFKEIVGHTVFWKDEPSRYGMTKSKAIEVLNIVKSLTNEDIKPENNNGTETEPETPTENEGTTTPTEGETTPSGENTRNTPTEPSEGDNDTPTSTDGETSTRENESGETSSTDDTEPNTEPETPTDPVEPTTPTEPETPVTLETPTEEPQYKIITISSVTYNSEEVPIFDDADYHKLKTTLTYLETTYPNDSISVAVVEDDTRKSIFYFYLEEELTWFLELRTNIDYALVSNVTTLDDIKALL